MAFAPGKSGNPGGRPKEKPVRDAIRLAFKRAEDIGDKRKLADLVWYWMGQAEGNLEAFKFLVERFEGKLPTPVVGDDEHDPVTVHTIVTGVRRDGE